MRFAIVIVLLFAAAVASARADDSETRAIADTAGRVLRNAKELALKLDNGRSQTLIDCDDQFACNTADIRVHRLVAWWPKHNYYVVRVYGYESVFAYLVRASDGLITEIAAVPVFSPNERFAVASDPSVNNGGGETQVLDMRTSPPAIITPNTKCWQEIGLITVGAAFSWIDNSTVVFPTAEVVGTEQRRRLTLHIFDSKAEWDCRA